MVPKNKIESTDIQKHLESCEFDGIIGKDISTLRNAKAKTESQMNILELRYL